MDDEYRCPSGTKKSYIVASSGKTKPLIAGIHLPFLSPLGIAAQLAPAPNITTCHQCTISTWLDTSILMSGQLPVRGNKSAHIHQNLSDFRSVRLKSVRLRKHIKNFRNPHKFGLSRQSPMPLSQPLLDLRVDGISWSQPLWLRNLYFPLPSPVTGSMNPLSAISLSNAVLLVDFRPRTF